jgi:hypothetical protein
LPAMNDDEFCLRDRVVFSRASALLHGGSVITARYRSINNRLNSSINPVRTHNERKRGVFLIVLSIGQAKVGFNRGRPNSDHLWRNAHEQQTDDRIRRPRSR